MIVEETNWFVVAFTLICVFQGCWVGAGGETSTGTCSDANKSSEHACTTMTPNNQAQDFKPKNDKDRTVSYKWVPEADHPCNIVRMTQEQIFRTFGRRGLPPLHAEPLVIVADKRNERNQKFVEMTSRANITKQFPPDFNVTLSSSNSFSAHRRTISLQGYLDELLQVNSGETTPDQRSNETWYLFGETYTDEWRTLLKTYKLPYCHTCTTVDKDIMSEHPQAAAALSFGIGNRGSGVQWHVHGPGFSQALHGRKHWVLYPTKPDYHPDQTSRHWMEYTYTALVSQATKDRTNMPWECTLEPGDTIYFPDQWYHATINLDLYTAFISTFTIEHL